MGSTNWDAHHGGAVVRGIAELVSVSEMRLGTTEPKRNLLRSWPTSLDLVEVDLATGTSPVCIGMIGIEPVTEATWTWSRSSVDKMALSVLALDALPAEVLASLFDWLLGVDLLRLSHASPRFLALLHANAALWAARLSHHYGERKASLPPKRRLLGDKSIRFRGRRVSAITDKGACVDIRGLVLEWGEIVAFDLWFSLLPADEGTLAGGVLLGVQTTPFSDPRWPFYHQQFIVVDRQRNLYCSVISKKQLVATALETERWYHLALMFDGHTQRVLLDGKLVSSAQGSIHHEAYSLRCMQLGTGCVSAGSPGTPRPTFAGWYGFNGLVDEFRTWGMTLSNSAISKLAAGSLIEERPRFSLRYSGMATAKGGATQVRCSRPRERLCCMYR